MTTPDAQTFARAFFEAIFGTAMEQLRGAAPKLEGVASNAPDVQKQIKAALPTRGTMTEVRNFLLALANEGALEQLPDIMQALETMIATGDQVALPAEVISAVALTEEQQIQIVHQLEQQYPTPLSFRFKTDETLIGGLIIRIGDQVIDRSLRARLNTIQQNMLGQ
ncbi:MAG: ATP synthase F1 subunit delta [Chloroflexaceae bacterium]|nr:ATP synthase F1 subunit delta [Chloroflexaceae bacterium]